MIKYLELTAPEKSEFRQAKIISIEINENDQVNVGDTLFIVKSGDSEINLPTTRAGRIVEIIAYQDDSISLHTPLILLETEVDDHENSQPTPSNEDQDKQANTKKVTKKKSKKKQSEITAKKTAKKADKNKHTQPSLNLGFEDEDECHEEFEEDSTEIKNVTQMQDVQMNIQTDSIEIHVPDIGADSAKVIEILVNIGDEVSIEDPLITLESDKASMDVPSTHGGVIESISVETDQDVQEGAVIVTISSSQQNDAAKPEASQQASAVESSSNQQVSDINTESKESIEIKVPDIGSDSAKVIDILIKVGDEVASEDPLITIESDKASMDVPCPVDGTIESISVELDQDVSEGMIIAVISSDASTPPSESETKQESQTIERVTATETSTPEIKSAPPAANQTTQTGKSHASPSIRRFATELGVDLSKVIGTGRKGRIIKNDVKQFVKGILSGTQQAAPVQSSGIPAIPAIDFTKFGEIEVKPLNRIKQLTATNLHRAWLNVPHVTHHDESNINDLESFRKKLNKEYAEQETDIKLSPLAFIVKAVVKALRAYPQFNSSLDESGQNLIYKKYINIGIAVETPNGLVVPVIQEADKKSVSEIATEMASLAAKARDKKLKTSDMTGACFTISSLGGIGGTSFTPIVNAPEVAILGVSRSKVQPLWNGDEFKPAMMLPLSLSYDHRVIDGAEAARFTRHIADALEDVRRLTV